MRTQELMQLILIVILLLCGYVFLFQIIARRTANKNAITVIAFVLLFLYAGIVGALFLILRSLGSFSFVLMALLILFSCLTLFGGVYMLIQHRRELNSGMTVLFILYVLMVGYITIFSRSEGHSRDILLHFDSVEKALRTHSLAPLNHLVLNIVMFVPIGILFPMIQPSQLARFFYVAPLGLMFSTFIETTQMLMKIGQCDIEDIVANTLGAIIGLALLRIARRFSAGEE